MRYKNIDGVKIPYTAQEETDRDAEEIAFEAQRPMMDWKRNMQKTDSGMPRYMEDLITNNPSFVIPTEMKKRYDDKIKVRGERP